MGNLDLKGSDLQYRTYQGDRPAPRIIFSAQAGRRRTGQGMAPVVTLA